MNPFDLPLWAKALIIGVLFTAGVAFVHHEIAVHDQSQQEIGEQRVQARWDRAIEEDNVRQRKTEETRAIKAQEADHAHSEDLARAAADTARAHAAADKLRHHVDELLAAARSAAGTQAGASGQRQGEQGGDAAGMLADMQRRTDEAAGRIGEYADSLRTAGLQCERYDALNSDQTPRTDP